MPDFYYIMPTLLLDAIPRNVSSLKRALTFLKEESDSKLRTLGTTFSCRPSLFHRTRLFTYIYNLCHE